jgi:Protein of unknown function (DUF2591)
MSQEIEISIRTSDAAQGVFTVYPEEQKNSLEKLRLGKISWDKEPEGIIESVTFSLMQDNVKADAVTVDNNTWFLLRENFFDKLCKKVFAGASLQETLQIASQKDDAEDRSLESIQTREREHSSQWNPSTDWAQAGPMIERQEISTQISIPLVAAMRCFVASKLGEDVDVPDGLVHQTDVSVDDDSNPVEQAPAP